jgi:serine protease AprX
MSDSPKGRRRRQWAVLGLGLALCLTPTTPINGDNARKGRSSRAREMARGKGRSAMDVLVRFKKTPGFAERSMVKGLGGKERRSLSTKSRWLSLRLPADRVAALADQGLVDFVTTDEPVGTTMDIARDAANEPVAPAPESALKGAGVTIAVVDSGVALHPDIQTLTAVVDLVGNPQADAAPPETSVDPYGHGTHVAGIMVGTGTMSAGGSLRGVAPEASLISVRVLGNTGAGQASDVLAGIQWIQDHHAEYGIRVANLSLGHTIVEPAADDPLVQAVEALWDAGVVVVCSAGNRGRDGYVTISSPCNSRKVITVGATNDHNSVPITNDRVATYSSRGPTTFDLIAKPDVIAPGNKIVSLRSPGSFLDMLLPERRMAGDPQNPNVQDYFESSGTSMASPMVAATAALMIEQEPSLNPGSVKARLMMSARKAKFGNPMISGAGYLDITAALQATWTVADALSPIALPSVVDSDIEFENTSTLWGDDVYSLRVLWADGINWKDPFDFLTPYLKTKGEIWPTGGAEANGEMWPNSEVWPEGEMWPDSSIWNEALTAPLENGPVQTEALASGFYDP